MARLEADITANATPFRNTLTGLQGEIKRGAMDIANSFRSMFLAAIGAEALRRLVTEVFGDAKKIADVASGYGLTVEQVKRLAIAAESAGVPMETLLGKLSGFKEEMESEGIESAISEFERLEGAVDAAADRTEKLARIAERADRAWKSIKDAVGEYIVKLGEEKPLFRELAANIDMVTGGAPGRRAKGGRADGSITDALSRGTGLAALAGVSRGTSADALQRVGAFIPGSGVSSQLTAIERHTAETAANTRAAAFQTVLGTSVQVGARF